MAQEAEKEEERMSLDTVLVLPPPTPGKQDDETEGPWWEQEFDGRGIA